jgi:hypothetical protein
MAIVALAAMGWAAPAFGGACCLDDGTCQDVPIESICSVIGGEYQGDGTDCATASCTGACCLLDGTCLALTPIECGLVGGLFQGRGVDCLDVFCGLGSCCRPDETCALRSVAACVAEGGLHLGAASTCVDVICEADAFDFPLSPGSQTLLIDRFDDNDGLRSLRAVTIGLQGSIGANSTIENLSGSINSGALVLFEAAITVTGVPDMDLAADLDETMPVPPLQPTDGVPGSGPDFADLGFISAEARDRDELTSPPDELSYFIGTDPFPADVDASGQLAAQSTTAVVFTVDDFRGFGSVIVAYRWLPLGACCRRSGLCTLESEAECLADPDAVEWEEEVPCDMVPCLAEQGACCFVDGSCDVTTPAACTSIGGVFQGPGVTCAVVACRGACCLADGTCVFVAELKCIQFGGVFLGDGVLCDPSPCPAACCLPDGTCVELPGADCVFEGGVPQGAGTTCAGMSCTCAADVTGPDGPIPDGNVDALDLLAMIAEWGSPCASECLSDTTGPIGLPDGTVDALDLLLLISQWGSPANCP